MDPKPQPRTYRIRLLKKQYEVNSDRKYVAVLDFSPGPMLRAAEGQLDGLVQALAWADGARGPETLRYCLAIHDSETDKLQCHWPAKTWLEA